jgi:hypothetical protein
MILEGWTRERLGKYVGSIQKAGNVYRYGRMVVSEVAIVEMPHLNMLRSPRDFGWILAKGDGSRVVNEQRSCWKALLGVGRCCLVDLLAIQATNPDEVAVVG